MNDIITQIAQYVLLEDFIKLTKINNNVEKILFDNKIYCCVTMNDIKKYNIPILSITNIEYKEDNYDELEQLTNLEILDLYSSRITQLPDTLINLKKLYMSFAQNITHLPSTFINLRVLNCYYTKINKIPETYIRLEHLIIDKTLVHYIPESLINLKSLSCSKCNIDKIPITLVNLRELNASDSNIKTIPEAISKNLDFCDF